MKRMPFAKLPHKLFYDKRNGSIVQISWLNDHMVVYSTKNEVVGNPHSYVVRNVVTDELEIFDNRESVSARFESFDDRFGWFELNDVDRSLIYLSNLLSELTCIKCTDNMLEIYVKRSSEPISFYYEDEKQLKKDFAELRRIISMIKKVKVMP